jgi:hypothetical protein
MSEKKEIPPLNIVAFAVAMVCGPVLVTLFTIWMYFIPAAALVFGGIPYLVVGTPLALLMALTGPVTAERGAMWGCMTIVCIAIPAALGTLLASGRDDALAVLGIGLVCVIFATAWAATSGWIYSRMTKPEPTPN